MSDPRYELMRDPFQQLVDDVWTYAAQAGVERYLLDVEPALKDARDRAKIGHYDRNQMPVIDVEDIASITAVLGEHGIPDSVEYTRITAWPGHLIPLQHQLHTDKVIDQLKRLGKDAVKTIQSQPIIITEDMHIVDGHHRWLGAMMNARSVQLSAFIIAAPSDVALPLLLDWSDKHHPRNE